MRLRQEQVVFVTSLGVLALIGFSLDRGSDGLRGTRRAEDQARFVSHAVRDLEQVLPDRERAPRLTRELFVAPRDTRRLPPLDLVEPPRDPLATLLPPPEPGPAPLAFGRLLRRPLEVFERPDLFDSLGVDDVRIDAQAEEGALDELRRAASARAGDGIETPAGELARQVGYQNRYDWVLRRSGTTIYGRIVNPDRFDLMHSPLRDEEAIQFVQVDPETGREVYASVGAPAIPIEREALQSFGFARTPANEIELARRALGDEVDAANVDEALSLAERCIRLRLEAPRALAMAKELFAAANRFDPRSPRPRLGLARAHAAGFDFDAALGSYEAIAEDFPTNVEAQLGLAEIEERFLLEQDAERRLRAATGLPVERWRARWALGRFLAERQRTSEALAELSAAALDAPQDPASLDLRVALRADLGAAHLASGEVDEAARVFAQALAAQPEDGRSLAGLAAARLLGAATPEAATDAILPLSLDHQGGTDFDLALNAGLEALLAQRFEESLSILHGALQADPLRGHRALAALSHLAETTGHPEEALRLVELALEREPRDAWSLFQRGRLLAQRDDGEGARETLLQALEIEPDFEDALVALGEVAFRLGLYEDAELTLERALALEEERAQVHALRGFNALRLGAPALARQAFERAVELDAEEHSARAGLAWCAYLEGDPNEARVLFADLDRARKDAGDEDPLRLWAREQIERIADHAEKVEWRDGFERRQLRNGWSVREGVGPLISIQEGAVHVEGVFAEQGRTQIFREYPASRFVSFDVRLWIDPATSVRAGLFLARERQRRDANDTLGEVSLSRHMDGALEVGFVRKGVPTEIVELPEPFPLGRWVRLHVSREGEASDSRVTLELEGIPLLEGAPFAALGRATSPLQVGVFVEGEPGRRILLRMDDARVVYRD